MKFITYAEIRDVAVRTAEVVDGEAVEAGVIEGSVFDSLSPIKQDIILHIQIEVERLRIGINVNVYEIGRLLERAKETLPHGDFQRWIEETWGGHLPYSTAALYKKIYNEFRDKPKLVRQLPTNFLLLLSQDSFPETLFDLITSHPESFDQKAIRELTELYTGYKKGELALDRFEELTRALLGLGMQVLKGETKVRRSLTAKRVMKIGVGDLKKTIRRARKQCIKIRELYAGPWESEAKRDLLLPLDVGDIINEVDAAIAELERLKKVIAQERPTFFEERLAVKDGIVVMVTEAKKAQELKLIPEKL